MVEIPIGKRTYQTRSLDFSAQQLINCYVEAAQDSARSQSVIYGCEGLTQFADTGETIVSQLHVLDGTLFAVAADRLKQIDSNGMVTDLGQIPGSSRPDMAASNSELVIVRDGRGFIWDGLTLSEITDTNFKPSSAVTYMDGRFIFSQDDTQVFFHSEQLDGKSYDPGAFASAERKEDILVRPFNDHGDLILAGTESMEIWGNDGGSPLSFAPRGDSFIERGLGASFSMAAMDNTFYWLGNDKLFYMLQGYTPIVISDDSLAQIVQEMPKIDDAFAFTYDYGRHKFYACVFPSAKRAFEYDAATQIWHERTSFDRSRWRVNCYAKAYNKKIVGDLFTGKLFFMDDSVYTEDGEPIERVTLTPPIHSGNARIIGNSLEFMFDRGIGDEMDSDPVSFIDWSDEGGRPGTFTSEREIKIGKLGQFERRAVLRRMGQFRSRVYRIRVTDPIKFALMRIDAEFTGGRP